MNCPHCNAPQSSQARFCRNCGQPLAQTPMRPCPACQTPNAPDAKFCKKCGAGLTAVAAPQEIAVVEAGVPVSADATELTAATIPLKRNAVEADVPVSADAEVSEEADGQANKPLPARFAFIVGAVVVLAMLGLVLWDVVSRAELEDAPGAKAVQLDVPEPPREEEIAPEVSSVAPAEIEAPAAAPPESDAAEREKARLARERAARAAAREKARVAARERADKAAEEKPRPEPKPRPTQNSPCGGLPSLLCQ